MLPSNNQQNLHKPASVDIEAVEAYMLSLPQQAEIPIQHYFGPGVYIRSITMPAGAMAIGHEQKFEHLNILLTGSVVMYDDGVGKVLKAPLIFTGKPGRKIGQVIEECTWLNVFATDETDVSKLEEMICKKSETFIRHEKFLDNMVKAAEAIV